MIHKRDMTMQSEATQGSYPTRHPQARDSSSHMLCAALLLCPLSLIDSLLWRCRCFFWRVARNEGLQYVAVRSKYPLLQYIAVYCSVLQCVAVYCSVLHCAAVRCSVLQCVTMRHLKWQWETSYHTSPTSHHTHVTWLIRLTWRHPHVCHDSFTCAMSHSCTAWLIYPFSKKKVAREHKHKKIHFCSHTYICMLARFVFFSCVNLFSDRIWVQRIWASLKETCILPYMRHLCHHKSHMCH